MYYFLLVLTHTIQHMSYKGLQGKKKIIPTIDKGCFPQWMMGK